MISACLRAAALLTQLIAFGPAHAAVPAAVAAAKDEAAPAGKPEAPAAAEAPPPRAESTRPPAGEDPKPPPPRPDAGARSPVDIQPANCRDSSTCPGISPAKEGEKVIIVDEDFGIWSDSPSFVTETDRVVVRFVVRRALTCRVYAQADAAAKWQPSVFRYGGDVPAIHLPEAMKSHAVDRAKPDEEKPPRSCTAELTLVSSDPPQYEPKHSVDREYVAVDFRMGPFTDDEIVIHLYRFDRAFTGYDREGTIKIVNHKRYNGWIDLAGGVALLAEENTSATTVRDPFTNVSRVALNRGREATLDFMALIKVYARCDGNPWFTRADLQSSSVCFGLGAGLSLRDPLDRFYPFGLNITFGGSVSLNALLSLSRVHAAPADLTAGTLVDGTASLETTSSIKPGFAFALGVDPSLFASLVKAAVGFK